MQCRCSKCDTRRKIEAMAAKCATCANRADGCEERCAIMCELRRACIECNPDERNGGIVSMDVRNGTIGNYPIKYDYQVAMMTKHKDERLTPLPRETEEAVLELVTRFARLRTADVEILHALLNGVGGAEIARRFGYKNRATVLARIKSTMKLNPWIGAVYYMTAKKLGARELRRKSPTWKLCSRGRPLTRGRGFPPMAVGMPDVDPSTTIAADAGEVEGSAAT